MTARAWERHKAGGARKGLPVGAGKDGKVEAGRAARTGKERRGGLENEPEMIGQIKKNRYFCRLIW